MKKLLFLLTICMCFTACNNGEIERLKKENENLKAQIAELRQNQQNQIGNSAIKTTIQTNTDSIAKTKAQQVVKNYLLAGTAKERTAFVLNPKEEAPRMEKMYGDSNTSWENGSFQFGEDRKVDEYYIINVVSINQKTSLYVLKDTNSGLKIDWSVSQLLNGNSPMLDNIKKMRLDMDHKKHFLLTEAQPWSIYDNAFFDDREHMYSFLLRDGSDMFSTIGYCEKDDYSCRKLFENLKGNKGCIVSLKAWYPQKVFDFIAVPDAIHRHGAGTHMEIGDIQIKVCWK